MASRCASRIFESFKRKSIIYAIPARVYVPNPAPPTPHTVPEYTFFEHGTVSAEQCLDSCFLGEETKNTRETFKFISLAWLFAATFAITTLFCLGEALFGYLRLLYRRKSFIMDRGKSSNRVS